jgi:hypothetical protein
MKHYYVLTNKYASETSRGFIDTYKIKVFNSARLADAYVAAAIDRVTQRIRLRDTRKYVPHFSLHDVFASEINPIHPLTAKAKKEYYSDDSQNIFRR